MSQEILSKKTKSNLEILKKSGILENFYLAGGTGAALQLGHRFSLDLDFFTKKDISPKELVEKIRKIGDLSVEKEAENSLIGNFQGTLISFLKYDYPLLFPKKTVEGIRVADIRDIACMKISAISSRGSKKDFIDLFFIIKEAITLKDLLALFEKKYKEIDYNMSHILKSIIYFEDAEKDAMPKMIVPVEWQAVKDFLKEEIKRI
jgi:predicted nucleotidyltransferase component of viral defense system